MTVQWERRSLKSFGDDPLEGLAKRHDLVIVDHPFVGTISDQGCYVALDRYLDAAVMSRIADSVGQATRRTALPAISGRSPSTPRHT